MKRLLVTRPAAQAAPLASALRATGFEPVCVPTVAIARPRDSSLENALRRIGDFDWLVVTSANGVPPLRGRVPPGIRVAAVGPATAAALQGAGIAVHHVPDDYLSVAVAGGMGDLDGSRVLLARSEASTPQLHDALVERRANVSEAIAYRTLEGPAASREPLHTALAAGIDGIVFTSGSAVRGLLALLSAEGQRRVREVPALCIGPVTAVEASASGFGVPVVARRHTSIGLARAIADHFPLMISA